MATKVIEEKVVGSVHIGEVVAPPISPVRPSYVAPYVAPAVIPVAAARKVEQVPTKFLEEHKKIKAYLDKEGKKYLCPPVSEIMETTGLSENDVQLHISVMVEDEALAVVKKGDNPVVCSIDAMQRLVENLRKLRT